MITSEKTIPLDTADRNTRWLARRLVKGFAKGWEDCRRCHSSLVGAEMRATSRARDGSIWVRCLTCGFELKYW